jgi:hypothetical protein
VINKTVARLVAARDAAGGGLPVRARTRPLVDPFAGKIDELVDRERCLPRSERPTTGPRVATRQQTDRQRSPILRPVVPVPSDGTKSSDGST